MLAAAVVLAAAPTAALGEPWYLLLPPFGAPFGPRAVEVADDAPLNQWIRIQSFESAAACSTGRDDVLAQGSEDMKRVAKLSPRPADWQDRFMKVILERKRAVNSLCVSSADPRLTPAARGRQDSDGAKPAGR